MNRREQGSALLYTVVFLGLMVMAALVSIDFSTLEQRMSSHFKNRQIAFNTAETALLEAERCLKSDSACHNITPYDSNCTDGLCFYGSDKTSIPLCRTGEEQPWNDAALWSDSNRTRIASSATADNASARYIIEFMCYVPRTLSGTTPNPANPADWSKLYRITVLANLAQNDTQIMLQSTYKR